MTNCPNCGAPILSHKCEYCGTIFPEYLIMPTPDARLAKLFEDNPCITEFMTPNEIRQLICEREILATRIKRCEQQETVKNLYNGALKAMRVYRSDY